MKFSKIHHSSEGESLIDIAEQYRLSSWRAIAYAPGNEHIRDYHGRAPLAIATHIRVPPIAYDLLKQRVFALHRIRPMLERGFVAHEERITGELVDRKHEPDLGDAGVVSALLEHLDRSVRADVEQAQEACEEFVRINLELVETHLNKTPDIVKYGRYVNPEAGICWLLEKKLADAWFEMWSPGIWIERWAGCDYPEAVRRAQLYFGVIRSRVMQQVDRRLREAQAHMSRLTAERRPAR